MTADASIDAVAMITSRSPAVEIQMLRTNPLEDGKGQMLVPIGSACLLAREVFCDKNELSLGVHLVRGTRILQVWLKRVFQKASCSLGFPETPFIGTPAEGLEIRPAQKHRNRRG